VIILAPTEKIAEAIVRKVDSPIVVTPAHRANLALAGYSGAPALVMSSGASWAPSAYQDLVDDARARGLRLFFDDAMTFQEIAFFWEESCE
jgi:hypothetical protein